MNAPLTYWHSGGDLFVTGGSAVDQADAIALHDLYLDETLAAARAGAAPAEEAARQLARQIDDALKGARRWRRAAAGMLAATTASRLDSRPQRRSA
jgi:hypothetical protein